MTPEEKVLLTDFLQRLTQTGQVPADAEAGMMIAQAAERQPAALYLTVQRAVWLEHALQEAHSRIQALEARSAPAPAAHSGNPWLSSSWGSAGADNGRVALPPSAIEPAQRGGPAAGGYGPGGYPPGAYPPGAYPPGGYPPGAYPPGTYPQAGYANPPGQAFGGFGSPGFLGGGSSFLANAAATAAGVVAGEMIANAFTSPHHHRDAQGYADLPPSSQADQPFVDSGDSGSMGDFDNTSGDDGSF